jgi:hypothetical protein
MKQNLALALIVLALATLSTDADERLSGVLSPDESRSFEWLECRGPLAQTRVDAEAVAATFLEKAELSRASGHVPLLRLIVQPTFMGRYTSPPEGPSVLTVYRTTAGEALVEFLLAPHVRDVEAAPLDGVLANVLAEVLVPNAETDHTDRWRTVRLDASRTYTVLGGSSTFGSQCAVAVGDLFGTEFAATRGGRILNVLRDYATGALTRREAEAKLESLVR